MMGLHRRSTPLLLLALLLGAMASTSARVLIGDRLNTGATDTAARVEERAGAMRRLNEHRRDQPRTAAGKTQVVLGSAAVDHQARLAGITW